MVDRSDKIDIFARNDEEKEKISSIIDNTKVRSVNLIPNDWKVCVVNPHPDDSALVCNGTLFLLHKAGCFVNVLFATSGWNGVTVEYIKKLTKREEIEEGGTDHKKLGKEIREKEARQEVKLLFGSESRAHFVDLPFYNRKKKEEKKYRSDKGIDEAWHRDLALLYWDDPYLEDDLQCMLKVLNSIEFNTVFLPHGYDDHISHRNVSTVTLWALLRLFQEGKIKYLRLVFYETPWGPFKFNETNSEFNTVVCLGKKNEEIMTKKQEVIKCHDSQLSRTPYALLSESLAGLRASVIPEMRVIGRKKEAPDTFGDGVEVFNLVEINSLYDFESICASVGCGLERWQISLTLSEKESLTSEEAWDTFENYLTKTEKEIHEAVYNLIYSNKNFKGKEIFLNDVIMNDVFYRWKYDLRRLTFSMSDDKKLKYNDETKWSIPNACKQAAYLTFWFRKLKPIYVFDKEDNTDTESLCYVNDLMAWLLGCSYVKNQKGIYPEIISQKGPKATFEEDMKYTLRYRNVGPEILAKVFDAIWEGHDITRRG